MVTAAQLTEAISEETGYSKADIRHVLVSLDDVVAAYLAEGEKVKLGGLVQLEVKIRPARKKRMGRNPRTGEAVQVAAKPATPVVRARVLKKAKDATPSLAKARRVLA
jgi:nucleoid DNA-binding protein